MQSRALVGFTKMHVNSSKGNNVWKMSVSTVSNCIIIIVIIIINIMRLNVPNLSFQFMLVRSACEQY